MQPKIRFRIDKMDTTDRKVSKRSCSVIEANPEMNALRGRWREWRRRPAVARWGWRRGL